MYEESTQPTCVFDVLSNQVNREAEQKAKKSVENNTQESTKSKWIFENPTHLD